MTESREKLYQGESSPAVVAMPRNLPSLLPSDGELRTMLAVAEQFVLSNLMPDSVKTAAAALVIIQKGRELGIPPMQAIGGIHVIKGKPTCSSDLMMALIYRDHGDNALRWTETTNESVTLAYKRKSWPEPSLFTWTKADTERAQIRNENNAKYPGAMLRARCISAVARMAFNDSIGGMHTPSEIDPSYDDDGVRRFQADGNTEARAIETTATITEAEPAMTTDDDHQRALRRLHAVAAEEGVDRDDVKQFIADLKRIPVGDVPSRRDWSLPFISWATTKLQLRGAEWVADRQRDDQTVDADVVVEYGLEGTVRRPLTTGEFVDETGQIVPAEDAAADERFPSTPASLLSDEDMQPGRRNPDEWTR